MKQFDYALEESSKQFAMQAHGNLGQLRKYTSEPYIVHPIAVANIVRLVPHTSEMIAASHLHDVVEDTDVPISEIDRLFGPVVSSYVADLTDSSTPASGNRAHRKALYRNQLANASDPSQTIKVADIMQNISPINDLVAHDREFALLYLKEKSTTLAILTKANLNLLHLAEDLLISASIQLGIERLIQDNLQPLYKLNGFPKRLPHT